MNDSVIRTDGLTHYFGTRAALEGVSFSVPRGSVYALLGRNGSGKSTLIQILLGLLTPGRGRAELFGEPCERLSPKTIARVGYTPEGHPLPHGLRVRDIHAYQRSFFPSWNDRTYAAVLEPFGIASTQRASQLSRGQRAGLAIALALAPSPELLVMDDPSLGLDPIARRTLLEAMLLATRQAGSTIFFTSHLLDDVERVADHVAVLDRSVLRVACPVETLLSRVRRFTLQASPTTDPAWLALPNLLHLRRDGQRLTVTLANVDEDSLQAVRRLGNGTPIEEQPVTLEEAVLGYLGSAKQSISLLDRARPARMGEVA